MRPLVRSYGVISTSTLSPASTRMRFLRMRPAVWAMISCSFSSFTRKVAFGSSSVTTPGNSKSSSLAIRYPAICKQDRRWCRPKARKLAEPSRIHNRRGCRSTGVRNRRIFLRRDRGPRRFGRPASLVRAAPRKKPRPDPLQQLLANLAIRVHPLLAAAFDRRRIDGRPIFDLGGERTHELERLVVRLRRQRDDQVEIEPFEVVELLEGDGTVGADVDTDLLHG